MTEVVRILLVEDSEDDALLLVREVGRGGYRVEWERVETASDFRAALQASEWDAVLADYSLPSFSAPAALRVLKEEGRDLPFLIASGAVGEEEVVQALKAGAHDFVSKNRLARLVPALEREIAEASRRRQHREAERALRETEATLRGFYESAPLLMGIVELVDDDFVHVYANPATCRAIAMEPGALAGRSARSLGFPETMLTFWRERYLEAEATGGPVCFDYFHAESGSWLYATVAPIPGVGLRRFCYLLEDVSERKRLEESERARDRWFRALIENVTDLITLLGPDGRVLYQSPALEAMLGYGPAELLGVDPLDLVHPEDRPAVEAELRRALEDPERFGRQRYRFRHRDGSWRVLESTGRNLLHDPEVRGLVINTRDLTEAARAEEALRRSEEQLRQAQRMEAVGRLAGGVAHDFNNVLTAIGGCAEMLLQESDPSQPSWEDLLEIRRGVERAASLTRQLLAFSRGHVVKPRPLRLYEVVEETARMLSRLVGDDVRLDLDLSPRTPVLLADAGAIEQVLMNLVVNARDAMPEGGTIAVRSDGCDLAGPLPSPIGDIPPGRYARLAVEDEGIGILPEHLPFIFEPFFTTKESGRGTGLGLSTVYGIVKQAGGHVRVVGRPARGTTFEVYLPLHEQEDSREEAPVPECAPAEGCETVLVAEDEPVIRALIERFLEREGYTVLSAAGGEEALRLLTSHPGPVHLVLTDVVMPGCGGRQVADRLRELRPEAAVVFMSGYTEDETIRRGVSQREVDFLEKPFTPKVLVGKIREVLDRVPAVEGSHL